MVRWHFWFLKVSKNAKPLSNVSDLCPSLCGFKLSKVSYRDAVKNGELRGRMIVCRVFTGGGTLVADGMPTYPL